MRTANDHHVNRSSVNRGDANKGPRGLFTETQTLERLKVHAKSVAVKYPTMVQIVAMWKEQYDIEISYDSERQWRKSNWKLIQKTKQQLIESGEIKVALVGPKAVADGMVELSLDTTRTMKDVRTKLQAVIHNIKTAPEDEKQVEANRENLKLFTALTDGLTKLSNSLTKQLSTLVELSGHPKNKPPVLDQEEEEEPEEDKDFDPSQHQITDADRVAP